MPATENLEKNTLLGGTNCMLVFGSNDGGSSVRVRVKTLAHSWSVVATESHARENRAMYPHQRAVGQFALTLELKGYKEFEPFMRFMRTYALSWQNGNKPMMLVVMAVRNFSRQGVPIKGMSIGDHIGSMVFSPTIVFESAQDPLDNTILTPAQASSYDLSGAEMDAKSFFYPFSAGSQDTNVKAETVYDFSQYNTSTPSIGNGLLGAVGGAAGNIAGNLGNVVDDVLDAQGRQDGR